MTQEGTEKVASQMYLTGRFQHPNDIQAVNNQSQMQFLPNDPQFPNGERQGATTAKPAKRKKKGKA
jgi:hypothetical protein